MAKRQCNITFQDVKKLFQEKGIQLLCDEDDCKSKRIYNTDKFLMKTAVCNHEKTISLQQLKKNVGLQFCVSCNDQRTRIKYDQVLQLFEAKGAKLLVKEWEYNDNNMSGNSMLNFIGNCGHECKTTYVNILKRDYIIKKNCKKCARKIRDQKSSQSQMEKYLQLTKKICAEKNLQYIETLQEKSGYCIQHLLKCDNGHQFKRTNSQLKRGQWCNICSSDVTQFSQQQTVSTGDYHEQCVFNFLKKHCNTIEVIGNTAGMYDIIYTLDDKVKRGIQVKTLTRTKYKDNVYGCNIYKKKTQQKLPNNTLFVLINQKDSKYVVDMSQNFSTNKVTIFFNSNKCKYQNIKFSDQNLFLQKLISLLPKSSEIDVSKMYYSDIQKEINCFERLQKKCAELGLSFQRNTTNSSCVDCYINHKKIQVKYREGDHKKNTINFNLDKSGGHKNGKRIRVPYSKDDQVEFFIFEYGGQNGKFLFQFCILSKEFLMQKKYISYDNFKGKRGIHIWKPDSVSDKDKIGTSKFWDKFDQLQ